MSQGLILENEDYPLLTGRRCTLQALADDGMAGVALLSASMSTAICGVSRGGISGVNVFCACVLLALAHVPIPGWGTALRNLAYTSRGAVKSAAGLDRTRVAVEAAIGENMYHMRVRLPMTLGRPFLFRHILGDS
ncbi:hypothetical protein [Bifidobacterium longum]|uniref:hypothetical protein n=1 Tax=Bifidobacterium longum TaxID=216816 RepID=UPI002024E573|nr:hypothetical protein [Bifidobacterium longum]